MKTPSTLLLALTTLGGLAPAALACDACTLYVADAAGQPGFTLSTAHQFTRLGSLWSGEHRLGNPADQYLDSHITQLAVGYSRDGRWHAQLALPYVSRGYRRPDHTLIEQGHESGPGDATLAARYRVWQTTTGRGDEFELNLLGGVKFGTGDTDPLEPANHIHHHFVPSGVHEHDFSLGSGSTDWLVGADASWQRGRLFARGQFQHRLRRPGAFAYRFGDETSWELGTGGFVVLTSAHSLALQALFSTDRKRLDSLAGVPEVDTGSSVCYLGARVSGSLGRRFEADASLELPVRIRTTGMIVVPDYRLRAAVNWRF